MVSEVAWQRGTSDLEWLVLILVVVEDGLRARQMDSLLDSVLVLILVVVEDGLRDKD